MSRVKRISRGPSELGDRYQIVVVGSGYGGGVAASRLARAGQEVCVLERGREMLPGEYPDTLVAASAEVQIDAEDGLIGSPLGLYDLHMNPDVNVFIGCGLGGTSLINANVALEMDERLLVEDDWPAALRPRDGTLPLETYYRTARAMLGSTPYPERYPRLYKLEALRMGAEVIGRGDAFYRPPINVTFEDQTNPFGVEQPACNGCGDCCSGCNVGSKNTTLMNYLPDAHNHGARIFTLCRVEHLGRDGTGWKVHVQTFSPKGEAAEAKVVRAEIVVLAAGTLGSTEILLRSASRGLELSPALGRGFSGNGDVVALGYNCYWENEDGTRPGDQDLLGGALRRLLDTAIGRGADPHADGGALRPKPIHGIGVGANEVPTGEYPGPCITGIIDLRKPREPGRRLVVEEGVIPGGLADVLPPALSFGNVLRGNPGLYGPQQEAARLTDAQRLADLIRKSPTALSRLSYDGPTARSQTYLVMSQDEAAGRLRLDGPEGRVRVEWPGAGRSPVIEHDNSVLERINLALQGQFVPNPLWTEPMGRQLITVHPVGGCRMSDSPAEGVVNDRCQVYAGSADGTVHAGLYVCDGAVMPGAVGVNPLLTITAVAERAMELLCGERGWTYDTALAARKPLPVERGPGLVRRLLRAPRDVVLAVFHWLERIVFGLAARLLRALANRFPASFSPSLEFSESMKGYVSLEVAPDTRPAAERISNDYELAFAEGREHGDSHWLDGSFNVKAETIWRLVSDPHHRAELTGTVTCAVLGAEPMTIEGGELSLLAVDESRVETWLMTYTCTLAGGRDGPLSFEGRKVLHKQPGSYLWTDVTRLFVDVYRKSGDARERVARGILNLGLADLARQAGSFRMEPTSRIQRWLRQHIPAAFTGLCKMFVGKFAAFFGMTLFKAYGGLMADLADFEGLEDEERRRRRRALRAPRPTRYSSVRVGGEFALTRYEGGGRGPVILAPGFSVAASSFATLTVDENLVEFLTAADYDVWLFDYQASPDSRHATRPFTIDDIVDQWKRAIWFVRSTAGADSVQAVAHCMASMTLLMALMDPDGERPPVRSAVCSQTTCHPVTDWLNYVKTDIGLAKVIEDEMGIVDLRSLDASDHDGRRRKKAVDQAKTLDTMLWGVPVPRGEECTNPVCHRVTSVFGPSWTHAQLGHETHIALRDWFGRISTTPFAQLAEIIRLGYPVTAAGEDKYMPNVARLDLPLTFIAGDRNQIFLPETSRRTYEWLRAHNGPANYRRRVFEGYAHMDCFVGRRAAEDIFPYILDELERFNR